MATICIYVYTYITEYHVSYKCIILKIRPIKNISALKNTVSVHMNIPNQQYIDSHLDGII
ncbi:hypothetical protein C2G38_2085131, partial [Gigaspora rosea]